MLRLEVGSVNNRDINIDDLFYVRSQAHPEWFEDPFVCRMIQEIDKTEVLGNGAFQSPILGIISSDRLSGSVKTLIILYELPTIKLWGSACGDNCLDLMFEISILKRDKVCQNLCNTFAVFNFLFSWFGWNKSVRTDFF